MNDGGPAFPRPSGEAVDMIGNHFWPQAQDGMSLRDYFAAAALAVIANGKTLPTSNGQAAVWAYDMADAMIAARNK